MKNLQKMGGVAALYGVAAYLFAMVGYLLILGDVFVEDPIQRVTLLVENQSFLYILNLFTYTVFGLFLVVLTLALYDRLKVDSPGLVHTATAIGLIWACVVIASGMVSNIGMDTVVDLYGNNPVQAATVWLAIDSVVMGLGGAGGEILGGLWILLASWAALRAGEFPRVLNYLGVVIGVAGLLSVVPGLGELRGLIFGIGQLPWLIWLGIIMLRDKTSVAA